MESIKKVIFNKFFKKLSLIKFRNRSDIHIILPLKINNNKLTKKIHIFYFTKEDYH